jgi:hypothetical protein
MITATYRLRGKRHSGLTDAFTIEQETAPGVWAPVDLTGWTARLQVRTLPNETAALVYTMTEGAGLTITPAAGHIAMHVPEADADMIPCGSFWFDLRLTPPAGGDSQYLVSGPFLWESVVTVP